MLAPSSLSSLPAAALCFLFGVVLEVDLPTLSRRLAARPETEWGGRASEREFIARLHATKADVPRDAVVIDAQKPIADVVDAILVNARLAT